MPRRNGNRIRQTGMLLGLLLPGLLLPGANSGATRAAGAAAPPTAPAPATSMPLRTSTPWSRATAPGATVGAAYFEISNDGPADDLIAIESPASARVEMHATTMADGMMRMRQTVSVTIPAGGRVSFEPGGLHAMLVDLKEPLTEGEQVPLTLVFRRAGRLSVVARVRGLGAAAPPPAASVSATAGTYRLSPWPRRAQSADFKLVDMWGRNRTLSAYRGRLVVLFFGFVRCPDACPAELFKLSAVMRKLGPLSDRVQVLFVTLDPQRDSPQVLKRYVDAFDRRFVGLTGTTAQIDAAAASFFVEYARVGSGAGYTIDHSTSTFVLDAAGRLRLVGALKTGIDDYAHDLAVLAAE